MSEPTAQNSTAVNQPTAQPTTGNPSTAATASTILHELTLIKPSSSDMRIVFSFENLKGSTNYTYWSDKMRDGLKFVDLMVYAEGEIEYPVTPSQRAIFEKNDETTQLLIRSKLDPVIYNRVRTCDTAENLWGKLESTHKLKGSQGQVEILLQWRSIELKEGGDVDEYLAEQDNMVARAEELGLGFSGTYSALQLLLGLPSSWDTFSQTLQTSAADRNEELNYEHIQSMILQESNKRKVSDKYNKYKLKTTPSTSRHKTNLPTVTWRWLYRRKTRFATNAAERGIISPTVDPRVLLPPTNKARVNPSTTNNKKGSLRTRLKGRRRRSLRVQRERKIRRKGPGVRTKQIRSIHLLTSLGLIRTPR